MKSFPAKIVAAALLLAVLNPAQAAIRTQLMTQAVSINGTDCPELVSWSGGDPSAPVVVEPTGTPPKKHVGAVVKEPIFLEVTLPLSPALQNSLAGLCSNSPATQTLLLTEVDGTQLQANDALLVEARFPALDAAGRETLHVTLVFRPGSTQAVAGTATPRVRGNAQARAMNGNFRFTLAGLAGNGVARVEPFSISRAGATGGIGAQRDYLAAPGTTQIPDLSLTIAATGVTDWTAWRNDFLVQGNSGDNQEKNGSLEFLSPNLQSVLIPLQLSHVGIKRLARLPVEGETVRFRADLYCEGITVAPSTVAAAAASPSAETPAPTATPPAPTTSGTTPAPTAPAPTSGTTDPKTAGETKTPVKEPATAGETIPDKSKPADSAAAAKTPGVSNPEDKGPRDPADFPRYGGTVRTGYRSSRSPSLIDELADYTGTTSSAAVMEFFDKQLRGGGWTETSRYESEYGAKGGSKIISAWTKDKRKATVTIWDMGPDRVAIQADVQQSL